VIGFRAGTRRRSRLFGNELFDETKIPYFRIYELGALLSRASMQRAGRGEANSQLPVGNPNLNYHIPTEQDSGGKSDVFL